MVTSTKIAQVILFSQIKGSPKLLMRNEPVHEISKNVVCVTSKACDQPAHKRSLIRAFASGLNIV